MSVLSTRIRRCVQLKFQAKVPCDPFKSLLNVQQASHPCSFLTASSFSAKQRVFSTSSTTFSDSSANPPRHPSPYRLVQPHTFLSQFAPLHIAGWRLDSIVAQERLINPLSTIDEVSSSADEKEGGDLQDRRLVRAFSMGEGKDGWKDTMNFVQKSGEIIDTEDHHPTILIIPSTDYTPSSPSLVSSKEVNGYIVEISTHTHTPLPPYPKSTKDAIKMRPGITAKDIRLAEKLEESWKAIMGGKEKIEMKKE
ncbi:uncharacterized protein IL334_004711 [Kwoniella shivajii]|uniref:4a-hydroxytetrahydrobiopterin dehydratase n=1 Tax=Kwoniella shivajii TaxID=564305 RepID=A0ABZ1D2I1_9TREE|nr:hypothetical protein IL334_004711 [Kwoniella shivajii]